jgi:acetyl esterase
MDPEMAQFQREAEEYAKNFPPVRVAIPLDPHREVNDLLAMRIATGGPVMAETVDRWVAARGRRVLCRVYSPHTNRPLPVLVYFHGGGWVWSSIDTHDRLAREYASVGEVAVVSVDYALSPEAKFPQAVEECAAVTRYIAAHGAEWGLDPSALFVGGDSAGGNLALATALLLRDAGGPVLRGILAVYPVCDSAMDTASYREFGAGWGLTHERMAFYWDVYVPHAADRHHPLAAPLRADLAGLPPVLVQLAELDVLRSEGEALAAKLKAADVKVELEIFPGVLHGFMRSMATVGKARTAVEKAGAFMRRL